MYYVRVTAGVWFSGVSSSVSAGVGGLAAAVGVSASDRDAFAYTLTSDAAGKFDVEENLVSVANVTIPGSAVYEGRRRSRSRRRRALLAEQLLVDGKACQNVANCVAAAQLEVVVVATYETPTGIYVADSEVDANVTAAKAKASSKVAALLADPSSFFPFTLTSLGPGVTVSIVGDVVLKDVEPAEETAFQDIFERYGINSVAFFFACLFVCFGAWLAPKAFARLRAAWAARSVRRQVRFHALGKAEWGSLRPEMRSMTTRALAKLARYKRLRDQTNLEKMWSRRVFGDKKSTRVKDQEAEQFL